MPGTRRAVLSALACALLANTGIAAQSSPALSAGVTWQRFQFSSPAAVDIDALSLLTVPLAGEVSLGRVLLRVTGAWAGASLTRADGSESTVSGLTDTEISANVEIVPGTMTLAAIAALPTGVRTLTFDEMFVAGAIAADLLPFAITNWGSGGGAGAALSITRPLGSYAAGVQAGWTVARSYTPLTDDAFEYRPGNQFHVRAALDRVIGRSAKVAVQAGWQHFGADRGDDRNLFQAGDRFQLVGTLNFALRSASALVYAGWLDRGEGEFAEPIELLPAQQLVYGGAALRLLAGRIAILPAVDMRLLDSEGTDRTGWVLGAGSSLELTGLAAAWTPSVRARIGNIEARSGATSRFAGIELGLTARIGAVPQ
jgi:hypothetical protein